MKRMHAYVLGILMFLSMSFSIVGSQAVCPTPLPEKYQNLKPGNVFAAYFTSWNVYSSKYKVEDIIPVADKLTHIMYAFIKPDFETGRCVLHDPWGDIGALHGYKNELGGNFFKLQELKAQFPHLKILLSIGGGTYNKEFFKIGQSIEKMESLAQSCVDMLDFYDHHYQNPDTKQKGVIRFEYEGLFDGIDVDWEWSGGKVSEQQANSYTFFLGELKRLLVEKEKETGKDYTLLSALQASPGIYKSLQLEQASEYVDWFHLMAYDFFGPNNKLVGLNAPICGRPSKYSVNGAIHGIIEQGVSPQKIVLGIPSYGYLYEETKGRGRVFTKTENTKSISYSAIKQKYLSDDRFDKAWYDHEKTSSLYSPILQTFISYDGVDSIEHKVSIARQNNLQGVMLWKLSGDDDEHTLVHAIKSFLES